tara:strand:+ start:5355 stop:5750 length:396 start_codon:yes stop_codon:yes gene_type:complete
MKINKKISAGLTALVLGCSTSGLYMPLQKMETNNFPWKEGVTETSSGYESIACFKTNILDAATTFAMFDARTNIMQYIQVKLTSGKNSTRQETKGYISGSRMVERDWIKENGQYHVCVKVFAPYGSVKLEK